MANPTSLLQPSSTGDADQLAAMELDEENSTLLPNDYVYLLAHIPPAASLVQPFYSSDSGSMQNLGTVTLERTQAGLVLDDATRSVTLNYFPIGEPRVVFFGNEIALDQNKLRGGLIVPEESYDGKKVYKFNVFYDVEFFSLRHRPNHPDLISEADGGMPWENYDGTGDLKNWPVEYRVWWG